MNVIRSSSRLNMASFTNTGCSAALMQRGQCGRVESVKKGALNHQQDQIVYPGRILW